MTRTSTGTSQKTKAVDRLIWILDEAARRVNEEKLRYFTNGLLPLQFEMEDILKELGIHSPPFRLKREFLDKSDERSNMWSEITTFKLNDPTEKSSFGVLLCGRQWKDKAKGTVRDVDSGDLELTELRRKTLITLRRWNDWLKAEQTTLEPEREELEQTTGQDVKPEGTGRPKSVKQLSSRQCDGILKLIAKGHAVAKIHREGKYEDKGLCYATFLRQLTTNFDVSGVVGLKKLATEKHKDTLQKPSAKRP